MAASISLDDLKTRYPDGYHSEANGCFYFTDYDGEVGYFIELANGDFEDDTNYVELDLLSEAEQEEVKAELVHLG